MTLRRFVFLLAMLCFGYVQAQQQPMTGDTLTSRLSQYSKNYQQEKVHLHFDKPIYALGDTIWFEGYVVNALNNIPTDHSHLLHVDLIDNKNKICKSLQLPVNVGFASGDFTVPDSLEAGTYHIRAYTNWMRNFDAAYFFDKRINVINPFPKSATATTGTKPAATGSALSVKLNNKPATLNYDVQFFPEGGQLVCGLRSAVGFKAVGQTGLGAAISGKLVDELNNPVAEFKSAYAGMGAFSFIPTVGKTYTAIVKLPNGAEKRVMLPLALTSGYVITADNSSTDSLCITLQCTPNLVNKGDLTFMPLSNGTPLFFMKTQFPDKQISITAPKNKMPGGILQLTLLNAQNQPVAERLVFNQYRRGVKMDIGQLKASYSKKDKAEFELQALDVNGKPIIGSFSVAVTNADALSPDEAAETTIFSNLLLTSDLKGYIETPNYYFGQPSAQKNKELDNLMLTQGWRRFMWADIVTNNPAELAFRAEDKITVSGKITGGAKTNIKGVPLTLLAGQLTAGALLDTVTDNQGRFIFHVADSLQALPFRLQAKPKKAADYEIKLDGFFPPAVIKDSLSYAALANPADSIAKALPGINNYSKAAARNLASNPNSLFNRATHLKEVVIKDYDPSHKLKGINSHSNNLNGPGQADKVLLPEDIEKLPDLSTIDVLLPGTGMMVGPMGATLFLRGNVGPHMPGILVLIDGAEASNNLKEISPRDIESIEFMKTAAYTGIYGIRGSGGVLLITTKRGAIDSKNPEKTTQNSVFNQPVKLKEVKVKDYNPRKMLVNSHSVNLNGPGGADVIILPETLEKMPDLSTLDVLIPGTSLMVGPMGTVMRLRGFVGPHSPNVLILVDGVEGIGTLMEISPRDIESIEFMKSPAYAGTYGIRGSGGVMLITTKKGGMDNRYITASAPNSVSFKLPVYAKREFYSPQYDKPEKATTPDWRTTVYWKPDVITGKDGKASLQFYNTDIAGNYRVVIEGISAKGDLCHQVFNYKVE